MKCGISILQYCIAEWILKGHGHDIGQILFICFNCL